MPKHINNISGLDFKFIRAVGLSVAVIWASLTPLPEEAPNPEKYDKLIHVLMYAVLFAAWFKTGRFKGRQIFWGLVLLGFSLEILQSLLPVNRSFDLLDGLADAAGAALAWWLMSVRRRR